MFVWFILAAASLISGMAVQETKATQISWKGKRSDKKITQGPLSAKKKNPLIQEILNGGLYIRLTDNSLWEINPSDTPITQSWITPVEILVAPNDDPNYPFTLTNTLSGSSVMARKISSLPNEAGPPLLPAAPSLDSPAPTTPTTVPNTQIS